MDTLKSFLQEFAIFKDETDTDDGQSGDDNIEFGVSSQEDGAGGVDDETLTVDGKDGKTGDECQCECPCCNHGKDEDEGSVDDNIEIIDPEDADKEDFKIDIDDDSEDEDDEEESDPTKDYNIF